MDIVEMYTNDQQRRNRVATIPHGCRGTWPLTRGKHSNSLIAT